MITSDFLFYKGLENVKKKTKIYLLAKIGNSPVYFLACCQSNVKVCRRVCLLYVFVWFLFCFFY